MGNMQRKLDAIARLKHKISELEEELITAQRRWKGSSQVLQDLSEEKKRRVYRVSQFESILERTGLIDGYDPDELYLVLLTNRKRILKNRRR